VEPAKVLRAAEESGLRVVMVLTTHSHWDHSGGNAEIASKLGDGVPIVAGRNDGVETCTKPVGHGDVLELGRISISVLDTPCHTAGHVCYLAKLNAEDQVAEPGVVFTGDTLFVGGSGNLNSGTPEQMAHALHSVLGGLPDETRVFCGHNYTAKNLRWALQIEPENRAAQEKLQQAEELDSRKEFIHSTIGQEKSFNPFMRAALSSIQEWAGTPGDASAALLKVRQGKDAWGRSLQL